MKNFILAAIISLIPLSSFAESCDRILTSSTIESIEILGKQSHIGYGKVVKKVSLPREVVPQNYSFALKTNSGRMLFVIKNPNVFGTIYKNGIEIVSIIRVSSPLSEENRSSILQEEAMSISRDSRLDTAKGLGYISNTRGTYEGETSAYYRIEEVLLPEHSVEKLQAQGVENFLIRFSLL